LHFSFIFPHFHIPQSVGAELEFCLYSAATDRPVDQSVFANVITLNQQEIFISDLYEQLHGAQQIPLELIHAESAPGQLEIVLSYRTNPVQLADDVLLAKETVQAVAAKHGLKAIFLPKLYDDKAGNGLHVHLSYYRYSEIVGSTGGPANAFCDPCTGLLTRGGSAFLEGILQHLPALTALTMPTVNSFRRVGAGCWTGSGMWIAAKWLTHALTYGQNSPL
jgi:glutamine synthetase